MPCSPCLTFFFFFFQLYFGRSCSCNLRQWLQRTLDDDSEISVLSCDGNFRVQNCVGIVYFFFVCFGLIFCLFVCFPICGIFYLCTLGIICHPFYHSLNFYAILELLTIKVAFDQETLVASNLSVSPFTIFSRPLMSKTYANTDHQGIPLLTFHPEKLLPIL